MEEMIKVWSSSSEQGEPDFEQLGFDQFDETEKKQFVKSVVRELKAKGSELKTLMIG